MDALNYRHLQYFWAVAHEGSVTKAAQRLHVTQPTVSGQIRELERSLGQKLFRKQGRYLVLTDPGRTALRYADDIFGLGNELVAHVTRSAKADELRLVVGMLASMPKGIVFRILEPAFGLDRPLHLVVREGAPEQLYASLAIGEMDVILSDAPAPPELSVRAFHHRLGDCGLTWFLEHERAEANEVPFPEVLDHVPVILPTRNTMMRASIDRWFEASGLRPRVIAECQDSATLKAFGRAGIGAFPAPSALEREIVEQYHADVLGRTPEVREAFYAITTSRRLHHPAVVAITRAARSALFGESTDLAEPETQRP